MTVNFYLSDGRSHAPVALEPNSEMYYWRPRTDGFPSRPLLSMSNICWWVLDRIGGFAGPDFAAVGILRHDRLVHRLIVTPAWYRFPFMAPYDLQIGAVWTSPDARRQQLAATAIGQVHKRFGRNETRFWYLADADNAVSTALAKACGYRLVAVGRRTEPLGIALLGRFVIERRV